MDNIIPALSKGCLAGFGLVLVFFAISGLIYLMLTLTGLSHRMVLFISISSGPIIGTFGVCGILWLRALRVQAKMDSKDE